MTVQSTDPMLIIADAVTDSLSQCGYAFVEDDMVEALADTLKSFLKTAGVSVDPITAARNLAARPGVEQP